MAQSRKGKRAKQRFASKISLLRFEQCFSSDDFNQAYKYRSKQNWESEAKRKFFFSQKAKRSEANKKAKRSEQSELFFQNWVKRSEAKIKRSEAKIKRSEANIKRSEGKKIEAKRRDKSFRTKFSGQFLRIKNMTRSKMKLQKWNFH